VASFNRVILAGNLTRDPQLKYLPNNTPVCEFGLATNRKWKDRDGTMKEDVCFVDITAFGKPAEIINQYMTKGRGILIEGRLKFRQWTDKEGKNRSKLDVVAENFQFLGERGAGGGGPERGVSPGQRSTARPASAPAMDEPPPMDDGPPPEDADIPF
jgi:single-strand DNA-binding protein